MKRYTTRRTVEPEDLDALQHVNNVRYLQWVQEVAQAHWESVALPEWNQHYFWVVRSHHIEYFRSALLGDALVVETYVKEARGPFSVRYVEVRMAESGEKVAACTTQWCLLDANTQRPVRIPEAIQACFAS